MSSLSSYGSVEELIGARAPVEPVICILPERIRKQVNLFADGFPGRVLYPVKTNHDPEILAVLWENGIRHFDTASIGEIERVREQFPEAVCYFNHPVKPPNAIRRAYEEFAIADYVIDHQGELDKIRAIIPPSKDVVLQVRLAPYNLDAEIDFSEKFGADREHMPILLLAAVDAGYAVAVSFHTGWQTTDGAAYGAAISMAHEAVEASGVSPRYINVGGGFPSHFGRAPLGDYFEIISQSRQHFRAFSDLPFYCEPGSATVTYGQGVLVRVDLKKEDAVYLNDGIYGALAELPYLKKIPAHTAYSESGKIEGKARAFTAFGPTCDSGDVVPLKFELPETIDTGDWIFIEDLGAYSSALVTSFNSFDTHQKVILTLA
ncbi:MAG: hypothetical protein ACR2OR_16110 [Hyphomicrobiales bacterium]